MEFLRHLNIVISGPDCIHIIRFKVIWKKESLLVHLLIRQKSLLHKPDITLT